MDIATIDFETYYDDEYSLSKMTTEAYIRDPRFEVIGVGIKVNDWPTDWYSGDNVGKFLKGLDYSTKAILCHNTAFDGAILSWHFGIRPKVWLDTLSMARPTHNATVGGSLERLVSALGLGQKGTEVVQAKGKRRADFTPQDLEQYGKYCINDVNLTKKLYDVLKKGFPSKELLVIDQTLRMYTEPRIELDVPLLEQHLQEVRERKAKLLEDSGLSIEDIMSNPKFAAILIGLGVDPPTKISARTGQPSYAFAKTDKGLTDLLEHPDERVQAAVATRLGAKSTIEETRTEALIGVAARGRLPIMLNYYGAHTGRFSGGDKLNLQNLPSRGNNKIRRALKAPPGHVLIACDSSQIEARMVAWLAGQADLLNAFREKRDVYSEFATKVYGRTITKGDKVERFVGKTCILGLGYGMGAAKLQRTLELGSGGISVKIDEAEAQRIVRLYRQENWKIANLWRECGNVLRMMHEGHDGTLAGRLEFTPEGFVLPNKMRLGYTLLQPDGQSGFKYIADARAYRKAVANRITGEEGGAEWTKIYGGKVVENCIAGGTAVFTQRGWIPIEDVLRTDLVHDGVEFVSHGGVVFKSIQDCVTIDGVFMTPDHEVLTNEGWIPASQNPEPHRPDLRHVDGAQPRAQRRQEAVLAVPVPVRATVHQDRDRRAQRDSTWRHTELWVHDAGADLQGQPNAWHVWTSGVRRVAQHVGSLPASYAQGMAELRRAWDRGVCAVAGIVQQLLAGHGANVPAWAGPQSQGQRRPVRTRELRVDVAAAQLHEQAQHAVGRHTRPEQGDRHSTVDAVLPAQARPVFDILNAGPRQRFVVRGDSGPFVVHNCVQALAAIVIREQMVALRLLGYDVAFQVHDEIVVVAPESMAEVYEAKVIEVMSTPPKWAPDLPVACESGAAANYGDT